MMLSLLLSVSLSCFLLGFSLTSASDVLLPQPPAAVSEGDSLSLTCTYTGSDTLSFIAWYLVVGTVGGGDDDNKGNIVYSTCSGTIDASLYSYTCGTNSVIWTIKSLQQSEDGQQWYCKVVTSTATIDSSTITVEIAATCTCDNKDAICDCKTGMIVFTAINYVLDIVYFGIMVWFTLGIRALAKYAPQGNLKSVIIGCATSATIFLDIGLTINLFLNVESAEECCCTNGSNCGQGLRVALAVVGWLLSCFGFGLLIRHIAKGGCGGRGGSAETDHCNQAPELENLRSGDTANTAI